MSSGTVSNGQTSFNPSSPATCYSYKTVLPKQFHLILFFKFDESNIYTSQ